MLRDFEYNSSHKLVRKVLARFKVTIPKHIAIVRFEVVTPDSFVWRLLIENVIYYLYAEDYVPGLKYIEGVFDRYIQGSGWEFIKPKTVMKFESSNPVRSSVTYAKADDADDMMQYAVDSGHDFVFLVRSSENAEDAQFSESAPRGFGAPK